MKSGSRSDRLKSSSAEVMILIALSFISGLMITATRQGACLQKACALSQA
jgi:hypothetical protein